MPSNEKLSCDTQQIQEEPKTALTRIQFHKENIGNMQGQLLEETEPGDYKNASVTREWVRHESRLLQKAGVQPEVADTSVQFEAGRVAIDDDIAATLEHIRTRLHILTEELSAAHDELRDVAELIYSDMPSYKAGIEPLEATVKRAIFRSVRHCGDISKAARALGVGRTTMYRRLREYGIAAKALAGANERQI